MQKHFKPEIKRLDDQATQESMNMLFDKLGKTSPIVIALNPVIALGLSYQLQLALEQSENKGLVADKFHQLVREIKSAVIMRCPEMAILLEDI